ncbi:PP2C family protein-serine/threonine phosphatase, partial [Streptomyces sp. MB09-02B]|uniref:PP2C family protein-serine/threonine phosphatase n=1 Tax=Streptomyces sp. MB09-02B TaxID=3028667 RepID=UPI0029A417D9|nr:serine/threonine protein phosphatase [Streptomyces sp. MB09-02B]
LLKALTNGEATATPDLRLHDAHPGDRYLLCSDGLSSVVPDPAIQHTLSSTADPETAVRALVTAANEAGGPDNVSCVVADVVDGKTGETGENRDTGESGDTGQIWAR